MPGMPASLAMERVRPLGAGSVPQINGRPNAWAMARLAARTDRSGCTIYPAMGWMSKIRPPVWRSISASAARMRALTAKASAWVGEPRASPGQVRARSRLSAPHRRCACTAVSLTPATTTTLPDDNMPPRPSISRKAAISGSYSSPWTPAVIRREGPGFPESMVRGCFM